MKTLLSLFSTLVLISGAFSLGASHLDFGDAALAVMTAVMFGLALTDCGRARRVGQPLR